MTEESIDMNIDLPNVEHFDDFYIWFNKDEKLEYYSTPMYFYKANFSFSFDDDDDKKNSNRTKKMWWHKTYKMERKRKYRYGLKKSWHFILSIC